jgi:nucleoside-diphosphate-sugar epimerase
LINQARGDGMKTAIARFANVYGSVSDYPDRVVPAFARAAANGANIYIEGASHTFDFTSVHDVARGMVTLCESLASGPGALPPVHFASGRATTIGELAEMARAAGQAQTTIEERPGRSFDVDRFVGDTRRARGLLGWQVTTSLESGVQRLVNEFAALTKGPQERAAYGVST